MYVNLLFWYQFFSGFSGSVMTNSWVLIFFNLLFTSVPPLVYGVLDRDTPADTLMAWPELYRASPNSKVCIPAGMMDVLGMKCINIKVVVQPHRDLILHLHLSTAL